MVGSFKTIDSGVSNSYFQFMNTHFIQGLVAFVIWSTFSTWYYVTYIKLFDSSKNTTSETLLQESTKAPKPLEVETIEDSTEISEPDLEPISIVRTFTFRKNTIQLIDRAGFDAFTDSTLEAIGGKVYQVTIEGHTCDLGTSKHNQTLSRERAESIEAILQNKEFNGSTSLKAFGESAPLKPNTSEENRRANRRVQITITSKP